jgi:hypothetical protein
MQNIADCLLKNPQIEQTLTYIFFGVKVLKECDADEASLRNVPLIEVKSVMDIQ